MKTDAFTVSLALLGTLVIPNPSSLLRAATGTLTNTDGRQFEGDMTVVDPAAIRLEVAAGAGTVSYLFRKDKIQSIDFFDAEQIEEGLEALSHG
ncbi:MAG: hypothetical protein F7B06_06060, partial [Opitutae bacterium]|nr:hypothetical protein [Opitutae bacterium]